jgi:putative ABC transport system permease protein
VLVTPAFVAAHGEIPRARYLAVRLRPGASVEDLGAAASRLGDDLEPSVEQAQIADAVERAVRPVTVSLAVLAAMVGLAAAGVIGQMLVRHVWLESSDEPTLAALGSSRSELVVLGILRAGAVAVPAAAVAVVVALAASPFMPIGLARRIEPDRGFAVDRAMMIAGAFLIVAFVLAVSVVPVWRVATAAVRTPRRAAAPRPRTFVNAAAHAGLPPNAVSGMRLAFERGSAATAVPVLSSFLGATIAVAVVAGALTFGASLTKVTQTPRLVGWNWDVVLLYPEDSEEDPPSPAAIKSDDARVRRMLVTDPGIDAYAFGSFWPPFPGGWPKVGPDRLVVNDVVAFDGHARFGPSIVEGRKPSGPNEILFGPHTLDALHLHIGDDVEVKGQMWDPPYERRTAHYQIVGTGVIPLTEQLGQGATITLAGLTRLDRSVQGRWGAVYVRFAPGADPNSVTTAFRNAFANDRGNTVQAFGSRDSTTARDVGGILDVLVNLDQIDVVPGLFAALMGVLVVVVLAHVLVTTTRARRRDLAVLRALGCTRGEIRSAVAYEALIYAGGAIVVGTPVGIVAGRAAWRVYADNIGVVPEPVAPLVVLTAVGAGLLIIALIVSFMPGWRAAHSQPASVLRCE